MSKPTNLSLDASTNPVVIPIKGRELWIGRCHTDGTYDTVNVTTGGGSTAAGATSITLAGAPAKTIPKGEFVLFGTQVVQLTADCSTTTMAVKALRYAIPGGTAGSYSPLMQVVYPKSSSLAVPGSNIGSSAYQDFSVPTITPGDAAQNTITMSGEPDDLVILWAEYRSKNGISSDYDRMLAMSSSGSGLFGKALWASVAPAEEDGNEVRVLTFSLLPNYKRFDKNGNIINLDKVA